MSTLYKPAIHFNNTSFKVDHTTILQSITGSFPIGKITTLVGPSGAGKTTLLKLCNGLLSATEGEIFIDNKPIDSYDPVLLRRQVGIALQNATMLRGSVFDNLKLPLHLQGKQLTKEVALQLLEDVGLPEQFLHHDAHSLSGGQKQKVSIARTLVNKPSILLLDEITSALDVHSQKEIEQLITKINEKYKVTVIWITHNLEQAFSVGDYTWVMMGGKLIETGESSILQSPKNKDVIRFIQGGSQ